MTKVPEGTYTLKARLRGEKNKQIIKKFTLIFKNQATEKPKDKIKKVENIDLNSDFKKQLASYLASLREKYSDDKDMGQEKPVPLQTLVKFSKFNYNGVLKVKFSQDVKLFKNIWTS